MYEDIQRNNFFKYFSTFMKGIITLSLIIIVAGSLCYVSYSFKSDTLYLSGSDSNSENIDKIIDVATVYFNKNLTLINDGTNSSEISLNYMIKSDLINDFSSNKFACDLNNSYARATIINESQYTLKVQLDCNDKVDFIITTVSK